MRVFRTSTAGDAPGASGGEFRAEEGGVEGTDTHQLTDSQSKTRALREALGERCELAQGAPQRTPSPADRSHVRSRQGRDLPPQPACAADMPGKGGVHGAGSRGNPR